MRRVLSAILPTTLIGAGQGLFLAIHAAELWTRAAKTFFVAGSAVASVLAATGLLVSLFHRGRPENAWRPREMAALLLFMALAAAYGAAHHYGWGRTRAIGGAASAAALALFFCTAMIYASIDAVQEWASRFTIANFFLMGCSSGFMLAVPLAARLAPHLVKLFAMAAIGLTIVALLVRLGSLQRNDGLRRSSALESRTHEDGRTIRFAFIVLAFLAPIALVHAGTRTGIVELQAVAFVVQYVGLAMERWYFLAQANHPRNPYYQNMS